MTNYLHVSPSFNKSLMVVCKYNVMNLGFTLTVGTSCKLEVNGRILIITKLRSYSRPSVGLCLDNVPVNVSGWPVVSQQGYSGKFLI